MKISIFDSPRRVAAACVLVMAGAGLSACGGGGISHTTKPPPGNGTPPPATDSFFAYVEARVGALLDSDEPIDVEAVAVTTPDTTEPEPLK